MAVVRVRRGQITIPAEVRRSANVNDGDAFAVSVDEEGTLTLRPSACAEEEHPASDLQYWATRATARAHDDGTPFRFLSEDEFFAELDSVIEETAE